MHTGNFVLKFTPGNDKIGDVWNYSTRPVTTCAAAGCKICSKYCYAINLYNGRFRDSIRPCWDYNTAAIKTMDSAGDFTSYYDSFIKLLANRPGTIVRGKVGGGWKSIKELRAFVDCASMFPDNIFYTYCENYDIPADILRDAGALPNCTILFSVQPGRTELPPAGFPLAYVGDAKILSRTKRVFECSGGCEDCSNMCRNLKAGEAVHFNQHR